jgi:hypothetical protein
MFEFLWNNGLVRAVLALIIVSFTLVQSALGLEVTGEQWTLTAVVGGYFFGTGSVKPIVGAIKEKIVGS